MTTTIVNVETMQDDPHAKAMLRNNVAQLLIVFEDSEIAEEFERQLMELMRAARAEMASTANGVHKAELHKAYLRRKRRNLAWANAKYEMRRRERGAVL